MSTNPNTVKSQDELNEGGRKSDVLLSTIEKLEKVKKQRDKYYNALKVSVLKEQWESTLRDSMEKSGKIETLQKQLEIAQEALDYYSDVRKYNKSGWCSTDIGYKKAWEANLKIKDLNK